MNSTVSLRQLGMLCQPIVWHQALVSLGFQPAPTKQTFSRLRRVKSSSPCPVAFAVMTLPVSRLVHMLMVCSVSGQSIYPTHCYTTTPTGRRFIHSRTV